MVDASKDYYAVLGVLPSAEIVVIKAAYKALANIYHPDKNTHLNNEAGLKMAEINEAWGILSDATLRNEYDSQRKNIDPDENIFGGNDATGWALFKEEWDFALEYYPDLELINKRLEKISWRLALTYRGALLESKQFAKRQKMAYTMEKEFLELYFGNNELILDIARRLIFLFENKQLLRELNKTVKKLGLSDPFTISRKFDEKMRRLDNEKNMNHENYEENLEDSQRWSRIFGHWYK